MTFDKVGSLYPSPGGGTTTVGPYISLDFKTKTDIPPYYFGPFKSSVQRYLAQINHVLAGIEAGEMFTDDPVNTYIVHLWLKDAIEASEELDKDEEIMVKHADDKGDQIMVDSNGDLACVLDWEL